jgi:Protein required for attachment to host cells
MKSPPFLAVADSGHIKAYRFEEAVERPPAALLLDHLNLRDAFLKYEDRFTDQAGAFPSGAALGVANAVAERLSLKEETKARLCRRLAEQLNEWITLYQPQWWWFAAPCEINHIVLRELSQKYRDILVSNLQQNLVHVPASELLERFQRHFVKPPRYQS